MAEGEHILRALAQKLGIAQRVIFTGFVSDADLRALYSGARVCVCPSLYEGFGFTVLEAMACGTPVVCSSATSLPEVAGKAALYFDPFKPEEIAVQLGCAFTDAAVRASLVAAGRTNLLRFNWEKTARQTLAVYHQALQLPLPKATRLRSIHNITITESRCTRAICWLPSSGSQDSVDDLRFDHLFPRQEMLLLTNLLQGQVFLRASPL
jgi:hypothetical protein